MILILLGIIVMMACLGIQVVTVALVIRRYARGSRHSYQGNPYVEAYKELSWVMVALLLSGMLQMAGWACLYRLLGQFDDFETALYFSGVTFTSLGYGDITLPKRVRILSPMEAADGLMMFGIISAVFMGALQNSVKRVQAALDNPAGKN